MYYPASWNPLTMISSSLAHASWQHLIWNLVFFYAFSPMLEEAVNNKIKYAFILLTLAVITNISYSVFSLFTNENIPTLGLSGVVMGVIGLAAYMMPRAKIVTYIWFITYMKNHYISAWVLALGYIGWDVLSLLNSGNSGGINLIAHVSGGISGYLIGYFFLNKQKVAIKDNLDDAIDYARSQRQDTSMLNTYNGGRKQIIESIRSKEAVRKYQDSIDEIYKKAQLDKDSEAIILMLKDSEEKQFSIEIYDELFERMRHWDVNRVIFCTGRFCIDTYMHKRNYFRSLEIATHCHAMVEEFLLANPMHVLILAKYAVSMQQYQTAYFLVKDAQQRYGEAINFTLCTLLEIELLWMHLNKQDEAKNMLQDLLKISRGSEHHDDAMALAKALL